jgi:3-mercaptopyruvate sulfurtransferase SseA
VAHTLREQGFNAFVIVGGLAAWRKAGRPTETVPQSDLVLLPTFSRRPLPSETERAAKERLEKPIG